MAFRPALTLTFHNAQTVLDAGLRVISDGQTRFDLADLSMVDSAAVATLLAWQRAARSAGRTLEFVNFPPNLQSLMTLYGVDELLQPATAAAAQADLTSR